MSSGTKNAVTDTLPDTDGISIVSISEFISGCVVLVHLEKTEGRDPVAVMETSVPIATGIVVFDTTVYLTVSIVTATEPDPLMFTFNATPDGTKTAVTFTLAVATLGVIVLLSEFVVPNHLENREPGLGLASRVTTLVLATGIVVVAPVTLYPVPFIVTNTEPDPSMFTVTVRSIGTKNAITSTFAVTAVVGIIGFSEFVVPNHLEKALPAAGLAVMETFVPVATGIVVNDPTV